MSLSAPPPTSEVHPSRARETYRALFPTPALLLLMGIGLLDLASTALLHRAGLITELNPVMRVFIERSEWLFAFVKGLTLGGAWAVMAWYARTDLRFVTRACYAGSVLYLALWCGWFFGSH